MRILDLRLRHFRKAASMPRSTASRGTPAFFQVSIKAESRVESRNRLVTKNAILLVDNANERRSTGKDRHTALVEAGRVRLRPIMMTTAAMIFGMLPIALGMGEGGGMRAPMARAVIGGLITSTMLTLIVVPVAYTYLDDLGFWMKHRFMSAERERAMRDEERKSGMRLERGLFEEPEDQEIEVGD